MDGQGRGHRATRAPRKRDQHLEGLILILTGLAEGDHGVDVSERLRDSLQAIVGLYGNGWEGLRWEPPAAAWHNMVLNVTDTRDRLLGEYAKASLDD